MHVGWVHDCGAGRAGAFWDCFQIRTKWAVTKYGNRTMACGMSFWNWQSVVITDWGACQTSACRCAVCRWRKRRGEGVYEEQREQPGLTKMSRLRKSLALGLLRERASDEESAICGGSARTGWWLGRRAEQNSSMNDQSHLSKRQRLTVKVCRSASDVPSWPEQLKSDNSFWSWQAIKSEMCGRSERQDVMKI